MNFINPIDGGYFTSRFGYRNIGAGKEWHAGIDVAKQPNTNVPILASADGVVYDIWGENKSTYGNVIFIRHTFNGVRYDTVYAHLKSKSITVKVGDKVKQGQKIAMMGNTGRSTAPHLHFEIHQGAWLSGRPNAVNPEKFIKFYSKTEVLRMEKEIKELQKEIQELRGLINKQAPTYVKFRKPDTWAEEALAYMSKNKLTDGTYIDRPATRQELLTIAYNVIKHIKALIK